MVKTLSKNITFYIGAFAMFLAGVLYMLMSDLTFNNTADRLIVSTLLSFGSAIAFFFSSNYLEKPKVLYTLKGIGIALAVGFVIYIHLFQTSAFYLAVLDDFQKRGVAGVKGLRSSKATMIITLILGYLTIVAQSANTVCVAVLKED